MRAAETDGIGGEVFQLASGIETSVTDLVARLEEISGQEAHVRREPPRPGEILRNYSLIDKARDRLGYGPRVQLEDGLHQTYEWFTRESAARTGR